MKNKKVDGVIFDIDGVLIDVTNSYLAAVKKTTEYVLWNKYKLKESINIKSIEEFKSIPGFNNDWDLTYRLIEFYRSKKALIGKTKKVSVREKKGKNYTFVKDVFQAFYLGNSLFGKVYKRRPLVNSTNGLILKETLLIKYDLLKKLSKEYKLGITTSRPRFEALFVLRKFGICPQVIDEKNVVALDNSKKEKPSPEPILRTMIKIKAKNPIYVGDTINDSLAAKKANIYCIFVGKEKFGDIRISTINQISKLL